MPRDAILSGIHQIVVEIFVHLYEFLNKVYLVIKNEMISGDVCLFKEFDFLDGRGGRRSGPPFLNFNLA